MPAPAEKLEFYALYSPRTEQTISGCKVTRKPNSGLKLVFPIRGEYFPRLPLPGKTLKVPEVLQIFRLDEEKDAKLFAIVDFGEASVDKVPTAETYVEKIEEEEEEEEEAASPEDGEKENSSSDVVVEPPMPLQERLRLEKQAEEAEGDSSISSSSGGYDSKDEEILGKDSSSSSESDSDIYEEDFQKVFENAPEKFTFDIGVKVKFDLKFVKNAEQKVFQLACVTMVKREEAKDDKKPVKRKAKKQE